MKPVIALATGLLLTATASVATAEMASVATPPQGTVWNTMGSAIANVARSESDVRALVQPYGGNRAMLDAVDQGLAEFAINDVNDVITAYQGTEDYAPKQRTNLRMVMSINAMPIGIFVRDDSGIESIEDLRGKRVASGWNAFPLGRSHMEAMMATGNLTWADVREVPVPDLIRAADALASNRVDATYFAAGGPKVAEVDASVGGVHFLPVANHADAQAALDAVRPAFYFSTVNPAPHIAGVDEPTAMVTWDNVLVAGAHVPDEVVYQVVKSILENKPDLVATFPGFANMRTETASKHYTGLTYHPGAVRYFKEQNLWTEAGN